MLAGDPRPDRHSGTAPTMYGLFRKRIYTFRAMCRDIAMLLPRWRSLISVWLWRGIDPLLREEIMLAVSQVNDCLYCSFLHREWALHAGLEPEALADLEGQVPERFDVATWAALAYAQARAAQEFGPIPVALHERLREHFNRRECVHIETVGRVIRVANLTSNTVEALKARRAGSAAPGSRLLDEILVSCVYYAVAPFLLGMMSVYRSESPRMVLREFRHFSDNFGSKRAGGQS